jgi:hypothetical protein
MKYIHGIPLIQGDTSDLKISPDYFMLRQYPGPPHRYPHFPSTMVAFAESIEECDALYLYQKTSWRRLFSHGGASKHQTHFIWCLNRLLQSGAKMTVRQYSPDIDYSDGRRISILSIRYHSSCCDVWYIIDNDNQLQLFSSRRTGLDPNDYHIVFAEDNQLDDLVLQDSRAIRDRLYHEREDRFPLRDDPSDPQQPFARTLFAQCVWLHRLCQVSPGALSLEDGFKLYGVTLGDNELSLVGTISGSHLQRRIVPLNTPIRACNPGRLNNLLESAYTILQS